MVKKQRAEGVEIESLIGEIADDFATRLASGERPQLGEYTAKYPEHAKIIEKVLGSIEVMQSLAIDGGFSAEGAAEGSPIQGQLGDYRIKREIGSGGMGVVYEAEEISLGRRVALKILPFASMLDPKQLQRFKNEARAAAALDHPHIVGIHSVGSDRGVHYYAMHYIDGHTLAQVIDELRQVAGLAAKGQRDSARPIESHAVTASRRGHGSAAVDACTPVDCDSATLGHATRDLTSGRLAPSARKPSGGDRPMDAATTPSPSPAAAETDRAPQAVISTEGSTRSPVFFRSVANQGIQVAEALEHAHQMGVVHRDIKPSNLIVDTRGHLWITDFGLAMTQTDASVTMTGDVVGTLRYMSPEQVQGKRMVLDHRTDIYSLGITLYELLVLAPAFAGSDRQQLMQQIVEEDPLAPRQLNKAIPRDLETIILKAIAKEPEFRYATAQALADDLRRFAEHKPILACRPTLRQRAAKWSRRHRWGVATSVAVVVAALLAGSALAWHGQRREAQQRARAEENLRVALEAVDQIYLEFVRQNYGNAVTDARPEERKRPEAERFFRKVLTFYEQFSKANYDAVAVRYETAKAFGRIGDIRSQFGMHDDAQLAFIEAIKIAEELTVQFPTVPKYKECLARIRLGQSIAYRNRGDLKEAIAAVSETIRLRPEYAEAFHIRGRVYMQKRDFEHAIADYNESVRISARLYPELGLPYYYRGVVYMKMGDLDKAVADFDAAIRLNPEVPIPHCARGLAYANMGDLEKAITAYNEAIRVDPEHNFAYITRGEAYIKKGNYAHAMADLSEAIRLNPQSVFVHRAYEHRATAYMEQGHFDKGNADLAKAVDLEPELATIYSTQALALFATGQTESYQASCARMLQRFEASQGADDQFWTAWTCALAPHAVDELAAAVALANKVVHADPGSIHNQRALGAILFRVGRIDEAIARLTEANRLAQTSDPPPEYPPIYTWYFLAMAQHAAGNGDEAKQWLAKAVESTEKILSGAEQNPGEKVPWNRRLTIDLLRQEAEQRLADSPDG